MEPFRSLSKNVGKTEGSSLMKRLQQLWLPFSEDLIISTQLASFIAISSQTTFFCQTKTSWVVSRLQILVWAQNSIFIIPKQPQASAEPCFTWHLRYFATTHTPSQWTFGLAQSSCTCLAMVSIRFMSQRWALRTTNARSKTSNSLFLPTSNWFLI